MKLTKEKIINIVLRLDESLVKEIDAIVKTSGYTRSDVLRIIIKEWLDGKNKTASRKR